MSMVRPEVMAFLSRWRETLAGAALSMLGVWYAVNGTGLMPMIGMAITVGGAILLFTGFHRARLRRGSDGPGLVEITERQLTYFDALGGQSFSFDDVIAITIRTDGAGGMVWLFERRAEPTARIPANAAGANAIFDALAAFDGVDYPQVLRAASSRVNASFAVWQSGARRLH